MVGAQLAPMTKWAACAVVVLGVGGCSGGPSYWVIDNIDGAWDLSPSPARDKDVHSPYVQGAKVTLTAETTADTARFGGWSIVSSAPGVFRIEPANRGTDVLVVDGVAVGEGTATLQLLDPLGNETAREVIEVVAPERAELDVYGAVAQGREAEAAVAEVRMISQGTARYLVRYFRGDRELYGHGVLSAEVPDGMAAVMSGTGDTREWLTLRTTGAQAGAVALKVNQVAMASLPLVIMDRSELAGVVLEQQPESGHHDGDWLSVMAQMHDQTGARVFGVLYTWEMGGQNETGDLYCYRLKGGQREQVRLLSSSGLGAEVTLQMDQSYVFPYAAPMVECSIGGGGSLVVGLVGLGLVVRRRRTPAVAA